MMQGLTALLTRNAGNQRERREYEREKRFGTLRVIPKIKTLENGAVFLEELDAFGQAVKDTRPTSQQDWARALDDSLEGTAREWRNFAILSDPGKFSGKPM